MLDITVFDSGDLTPTGDIQRAFHSILASLTTPALEHVRLELQPGSLITPSTQDMDSRDATTDAQYADLHAVLARPIFSSLHRLTVVLYAPHREGLPVMSAKNVALKHLHFLRALFAPWCMRGIANLACVAGGSDRCVDAIAVDKGEVPCFFDPRGRRYDLDTALRVAGLGRWPG